MISVLDQYKKRFYDDIEMDILDKKIINLESIIKVSQEKISVLQSDLEKKAEEIKNENNNYSMSSLVSNNGIINVIRNRIKKNKKEKIKIEHINKIGQLESEKNEINNKINFLNNSIIESQDSLKMYKNINNNISNEDYLIKNIIKKYPEVCKNSEFMKEIIKKNISYIAYDQTNDKEIYIEALNVSKNNIEKQIKEKIKTELNQEKLIKNVEEKYNIVTSLLKNPKEVSQDKYKIPDKYYLESLKKDLNYQTEDFYAMSLMFCNEIIKCINLDGTVDKEVAVQIEKLYNDENYRLFKHDVCNHVADASENGILYAESQRERTKPSVFKNGITHNEGVGIDTYVTGYNTNSSFLEYLSLINPSSGVVLIQIPKDALNPSSSIPVFGITNGMNFPAIMPEYVIGMIYADKEGKAIFDKNDIPMEERTHYDEYLDYYFNNINNKNDKTL